METFDIVLLILLSVLPPLIIYLDMSAPKQARTGVLITDLIIVFCVYSVIYGRVPPGPNKRIDEHVQAGQDHCCTGQ